jgi:hypothetical protein
MIDKNVTDFEQYIKNYFLEKTDQLNYSTAFNPSRIIKISGLSLATANTFFSEYKIPATAWHVERVYSTTTGAEKSGKIKLAWDSDNLSNLNNYKLMQSNDAFVLSQTVAKFFLGWDAQSDTSVDIACMIDVDYRPGSAKAQIIGTASVNQLAYPVPAAIQKASITAVSSSTYTVPAGYYSRVTVSGFCTDTGQVHAEVNGTIVFRVFGSASQYITQTYAPIFLLAGSTVKIQVDAATNALISYVAEEYPLSV